MSSGAERVLIVAEKVSPSSHLRRTLETFGFDVAEAPNGEGVVTRMRIVDYEAILLECRVFGRDNIAVCKRIRDLHPRLPILVIGVSSSLNNKVAAFEAGADDYVIRPFAKLELSARLRSAIRRFHAPAVRIGERLVVGEITLDSDRHRVAKSGSEVRLTPTEFRVLEMLMEQPGIPISHSTLMAKIWGQESRANREHLRVVISGLRKKLEDDPSVPRYLITHAYVGYRLQGDGLALGTH
jgi:two-component system, OmpR family, KDP operon response regulator KdpE